MADSRSLSADSGPRAEEGAEASLRAAIRAFELKGAEVRVGPSLENLVRRRGERFEVEAQGLPNLIHELVHALVQEKLDDDHGFPYGEMPLDMSRADHRALLFEELNCCSLSCLWVPEAQQAAWYAEQVGILGVFYGLEDRPEAFETLVEKTLQRHANEFRALSESAHKRLLDALRAGALDAGIAPGLVLARAEFLHPGERCEAAWRRYRGARA